MSARLPPSSPQPSRSSPARSRTPIKRPGTSMARRRLLPTSKGACVLASDMASAFVAPSPRGGSDVGSFANRMTPQAKARASGEEEKVEKASQAACGSVLSPKPRKAPPTPNATAATVLAPSPKLDKSLRAGNLEEASEKLREAFALMGISTKTAAAPATQDALRVLASTLVPSATALTSEADAEWARSTCFGVMPPPPPPHFQNSEGDSDNFLTPPSSPGAFAAQSDNITLRSPSHMASPAAEVAMASPSRADTASPASITIRGGTHRVARVLLDDDSSDDDDVTLRSPSHVASPVAEVMASPAAEVAMASPSRADTASPASITIRGGTHRVARVLLDDDSSDDDDDVTLRSPSHMASPVAEVMASPAAEVAMASPASITIRGGTHRAARVLLDDDSDDDDDVTTLRSPSHVASPAAEVAMASPSRADTASPASITIRGGTHRAARVLLDDDSSDDDDVTLSTSIVPTHARRVLESDDDDDDDEGQENNDVIVIGDSDDDDIVKTPAPRARRVLASDDESDDDDDGGNKLPAREPFRDAAISNVPARVRRPKASPAVRFIDLEAADSDGARGADDDEENDEGADEYESSFIDDGSEEEEASNASSWSPTSASGSSSSEGPSPPRFRTPSRTPTIGRRGVSTSATSTAVPPAPSSSPPLTGAAFAARRDELTKEWLEVLVKAGFGDAIPLVEVVWSKTLNRTAGTTSMSTTGRLNQPSVVSIKPSLKLGRKVRIDLSLKVLTDEDRLVNTLTHELCHAAQWMVDGVSKPPHGESFYKWARRVEGNVPAIRQAALERGLRFPSKLQVSTSHSYTINFKYRWQCDGCGLEYGRHSKSIKVETHRCGACGSGLRALGTFKADGTPSRGPMSSRRGRP